MEKLQKIFICIGVFFTSVFYSVAIAYPLIYPDSSYDIEYNAGVIAEIGFNKNSLIIAVMEMIFWLLKNGFIKKIEK